MAWEKIESRIQDQAPVTIWIGIASVVVAVTIADLDPDDLTVSVLEASLMIRGMAQSNFFSLDIDLPCAVDQSDPNPGWQGDALRSPIEEKGNR